MNPSPFSFLSMDVKVNIAVYLSGEIHSQWRQEIVQACASESLPASFMSPVCDHGVSDNVGDKILGEAPGSFWKDHTAAKINAIRIKTMIEKADVVVVKFGEQHKQWNAAFDAGYAAAKGKPLIVLHPPGLGHALKEVDGAAMAVAERPQQVAQILKHVVMQQDGIDT